MNQSAMARLAGRWSAKYGSDHAIEIMVEERGDELRGCGAVGAISGRPETGHVHGVATGSTARFTFTTPQQVITLEGDVTGNELRGTIGGEAITLTREARSMRVSAPSSCTITFKSGASTWGFSIDATNTIWNQTEGLPIVNGWKSGNGYIGGFISWPSWVAASGQVGNYMWDCINFEWQPGSGNSAYLSSEYSFIVDASGNKLYSGGMATWP